MQNSSSLKNNFLSEKFYTHQGLKEFDDLFCQWLKEKDPDIFNCLTAKRDQKISHTKGDFYLCLAYLTEDFIIDFFPIKKEIDHIKQAYFSYAQLPFVKRQFIERDALKKIKSEDVFLYISSDIEKILDPFLGREWREKDFIDKISSALKNSEEKSAFLTAARHYAAWACYHPDGQKKHLSSALFKIPQKKNFDHLFNFQTYSCQNTAHKALPSSHLRQRTGFSLTDTGYTISQIFQESHYCIWCHKQNKDSCRQGMLDKKTTDKETASFKKNDLDNLLTGCPLDQKISEMNKAVAEGQILAALVLITLDNPLAAATGHRICNECMKACIYQKQDPVNIPQIETRVLKDILSLPWGFEIYSLLTRWNPLNFQRPFVKKTSGYMIMVTGMGPAGFTLAHHLLNEGHIIIGIDGLKIEPVSNDLKNPSRPIHHWQDHVEDLDDRIIQGFGGVAEYGITIRWDKNFLKLIRLLLERRSNFKLFGQTRLGSTVTIDQVFAMGIDHLALSMGAGRPNILPIKNILAKGVRQASDFLMALQLTGAQKKSSLANLHIRLPLLVIGGGLTAIDTATEACAYYLRQIEKFYERYSFLCTIYGNDFLIKHLTPEEKEECTEFLLHATEYEREKQKTSPDFIALLKKWGGIKVVYRKAFIQAPCYKLNHEEVEKAFEEGIEFIENITPTAIEVDQYGHASFLVGKNTQTGKFIQLPAKTILTAIGTSPNTILAREDETQKIHLTTSYFKGFTPEGQEAVIEKSAKPRMLHNIMHHHISGKKITYYGDLHPSYAGNVVKAMASAKQTYPLVNDILLKQPPSHTHPEKLLDNLDNQLTAYIESINYLGPQIVEIIVHAPLAAKNFKPGQFYRFQNFETGAPYVQNTLLAMEGLALTGAWVNAEKGLVSLITLEMGGSSSLCRLLKPGQKVSLMGPTGTPTHIPENKTVLLIGGGLGNAVLFSIGKKMREKGCKVLYFAAYRKKSDRFKIQEIQEAADYIVWCCQEETLDITRPTDLSYKGNVIQALIAYGKNMLGQHPISLKEIDQLLVIGSDTMMAAIAEARHSSLKPYLNPDHTAIASINSPMQCMMKEICAQCLQTHIDPQTKETTYIFSCVNQDQNLDYVDFHTLNKRLKQNSLSEKLTRQWITHCLEKINEKTSYIKDQ